MSLPLQLFYLQHTSLLWPGFTPLVYVSQIWHDQYYKLSFIHVMAHVIDFLGFLPFQDLGTGMSLPHIS